ncbi:acyl-CoA dehydrogenase C-terminal domain-containing protein, partial [Pseudacidovorax sp. NFM-22]
TPEAQAQDAAFMQAKVATARFYAEHILVKAGATRDAIVGGAASVTALPLEAF